MVKNREWTGRAPLESGEAKAQSRCEVCGRGGETIIVPLREPPNRFCHPCAIEYGDTSEYED